MRTEPISQHATLTPRRAIDDNFAVLHAMNAGDYDPTILARWHGWGAAPKIFDGVSYPEEHAELVALIGKEAAEAAARTTLNAHYTAPGVAEAMWDAVPESRYGPTIEAGCGRGTFFTYAPEDKDDGGLPKVSLIGVELDPTTASVCQARFPDATVIAAGFETVEMNSGSATLAIGNVPFGNFKLFDPIDNPARRLPIHTHFMVKAARLLAPGGMAMLITSRYFMDSAGTAGRDAVGDHADFIGAIRFPTNTHKAEAGCEVVMDLVVLRGRAPGDVPNHAGSWNTRFEPVWKSEVLANQWFEQNPSLVLGKFEVRSGQFGPDLYVDGDPEVPDLPSALATVIGDHFDEPLEPLVTGVFPERVKPKHTVCPGTVRVSGELVERYTMDGWETVDDKTGELAALVEIGELARTVVANDQNEVVPNPARPKLKAAYTSYVKNWGHLNRSRATKTGKRTKASLYGFRNDPNWLLVSALEIVDDETHQIEPAPIMDKSTHSAPLDVRIDSDADALRVVLGRTTKVDLQMLAELREDSADAVLARLEKEGAVFLDPETGVWEDQTLYLSGHIRNKLAAVAALDDTDMRKEPYTEALTAVCPSPATAGMIQGSLGAAWVPVDLVSEFANQHLGGVTPGGWAQPPCVISWSKDVNWVVRTGSGDSPRQWTLHNLKLSKLIAMALNNTTPKIYLSKPDGRKVIDASATEAVADKIELIKEEWDRWITQDPKRLDRLINIFTDLFRSTIERDFSRVPVTPVGLNPNLTIWPHQNTAIARIVHQGHGMVTHPVGAGKTIVMVVAGMELVRLGRGKMPLYAVPGHTVGQFAAQAQYAYPGARIFCIDKTSVSPKNREQLAVQIETGGWDMVVMSHESFGRWPISGKAQAWVYHQEIADVRAEIDKSSGEGAASKSTVKRLEKRMLVAESNAKAALHEMTAMQDEHSYSFDLAPFWPVFIDEAHVFKNLKAISRPDVLGMPTTESKRAKGALAKFDLLRMRYPDGPGAIGITGTPVSNTMVELWAMARLFSPHVLDEYKIHTIEAFISMFGKSVTSIEMGRDGNLAPKTRLSQYVQLPQLARWLSLWVDRVPREELGLKVPDLEGGDRTIIEIEPHPGLVEWIAGEATRRAIALKQGGVDPEVDNHLKLDYDVKARSRDWASYSEKPLSVRALNKHCMVRIAARQIHADWKANKRNVYKTAAGNEHPTRGAAHLVFADAGTPKKGDRTTIYARLRQYLVEFGVPDEQIGFIHDHDKDDETKEEFFEKIRNGTITVAVGSTEKMGTGTNVQNRLATLHHLTCPFRSSDVEQRDGRIIRQLNQNAMVAIRVYVVIKSGSIQEWQRVFRKAMFMAQASNCSINGPETTELEDLPELIGYAKLREASTGDPDFALQSELESTVNRLSRLQRQHKADVFSANAAIQRLAADQHRAKARVDRAQRTLDLLGNDPGGSRWTSDGDKVTERFIGEAVNKPYSYQTWDLTFENSPVVFRFRKTTEGMEASYDYKSYYSERFRDIEAGDMSYHVLRLRTALQNPERALELAVSEQRYWETFAADQVAIAAQEFRHQEPLDAARIRLAEVTDRLLIRYASAASIGRIDKLFGPPSGADSDVWRHLRTAGVQNEQLLTRWEHIAEGVPFDKWEHVSEGLQGLDVHARRLIDDYRKSQELDEQISGVSQEISA